MNQIKKCIICKVSLAKLVGKFSCAGCRRLMPRNPKLFKDIHSGDKITIIISNYTDQFIFDKIIWRGGRNFVHMKDTSIAYVESRISKVSKA